MPSTTTATQLRQLREDDRLKYHGVEWQVRDYSTYIDAKGYELEEWLLKSNTGKKYYLLREVDLQDSEAAVHWYLAEELRTPAIYHPETSQDLLVILGDDMRSHKPPYPELRLHNRTYQFESQTEGDYTSDGDRRHRITWDYWDAAHLWNLALEAWADGKLIVYSTREVQPADFTDLHRYGLYAAPSYDYSQSSINYIKSPRSNSSRPLQILMAWLVVVIGFCLMIGGV